MARPKDILEIIVSAAVHVSVVDHEAYGSAGGATLVGGILIARLASLGIGVLLQAIDRQSAKLATTDEQEGMK